MARHLDTMRHQDAGPRGAGAAAAAQEQDAALQDAASAGHALHAAGAAAEDAPACPVHNTWPLRLQRLRPRTLGSLQGLTALDAASEGAHAPGSSAQDEAAALEAPAATTPGPVKNEAEPQASNQGVNAAPDQAASRPRPYWLLGGPLPPPRPRATTATAQAQRRDRQMAGTGQPRTDAAQGAPALKDDFDDPQAHPDPNTAAGASHSGARCRHPGYCLAPSRCCRLCRPRGQV